MVRRNKRLHDKGPPQQVRIIGGRWRGRKLKVAPAAGLRPTPDRVRETLFNWLQPALEGSHCLDLFAGSGALGFEALSRGAESVVMVESNPALAALLQEEAVLLGASSARIVHADALAWLNGEARPFDIVFLDPPFSDSLLERACSRLLERQLLADGALVYMESADNPPAGPPQLEKIKQGQAGQVQYRLLKFKKISNNDENSHLSRNL